MGSDLGYARIDTLELKSLIFKKIGHQRADMYFDLLRQWFASKITKDEFDKLCTRTISQQNLPLHNCLIRAIAKNAFVGKIPPSTGVRRVGSTLHVKAVNGYQRSCLQSLHGDAFPSSPRKGRSPISRDRQFKDRPSPLGPLGKPQSLTCDSRAQEQRSASELLSPGSRPPVEVASVEDGEEVEQVAGNPGVQSRSPITPPLGIYMNLGGARKTLPSLSSNYRRLACLSSGELPDTRSLRSRLEQKLDSECIGISVDCVNLLNNAMDAYLKRLIEPCLGLAGARFRSETLTNAQLQHIRNFSGLLLPDRCLQRLPQSFSASMLDFHAAMESNPRILGEDWSLQLEKISMRASEESEMALYRHCTLLGRLSLASISRYKFLR